MPCPLPRWTKAGALVGCFPAPRGPSPYLRRVGVHDFTFEACSGFTRVTACRIAQPPNGGLCHAASTCPVTQTGRASATRSYRQLPGWILPPLVNRAVGAHVESRTGAVAMLRFPSPLIKPDVRISRIRLSDWFHHGHTVGGPYERYFASPLHLGSAVELAWKAPGLMRCFVGSRQVTDPRLLQQAHQKSGPFPPLALSNLSSTMTLSDTHLSRHPKRRRG